VTTGNISINQVQIWNVSGMMLGANRLNIS